MSHNICFHRNQSSILAFETPSPLKRLRRYSEADDNFEATPLSPIKMSFTMERPTPESERELYIPHCAQMYTTNTSAVVQQYIELLQADSDVVKSEAATSLLQSLRDVDNAMSVLERDGIFWLVKALESNNENVRLECTKCLGKISSFNASLRDNVIFNNGLIAMLQLLNSSMSGVSQHIIIESISKCFTPKVRPSMTVMNSFFQQITALLQDDNKDCVISEVCKIVVYLCGDQGPYTKVLIDLGIKARLMQLLTHKSEVTVTAALRAIRCLILPTTKNITLPIEMPSEAITSHHWNSCDSQHQEAIVQPTYPTSAEKEDIINKWVISPLTAAMKRQSSYSDNLCEMDFIICQNVEMFKASEEDTNEATLGQVGFRCIHCGSSPFARAQFSTVYPGSTSLMAASLRHMTKNHFVHCTSTPIGIRRRIEKLLLTDGEQLNNEQSLKAFCNELGNNCDVVDRYPFRSGILVGDVDECAEQLKLVPPSSSTYGSLTHPLAVPSWAKSTDISDNNEVNYDTTSSPRISLSMKNSNKSKIGLNVKTDMNTDVPQQSNAAYFQDHAGVWKCRDCNVEQFSTEVDNLEVTPVRLPGKHSHWCPQTQAQCYDGKASTALWSPETCNVGFYSHFGGSPNNNKHVIDATNSAIHNCSYSSLAHVSPNCNQNLLEKIENEPMDLFMEKTFNYCRVQGSQKENSNYINQLDNHNDHLLVNAHSTANGAMTKSISNHKHDKYEDLTKSRVGDLVIPEDKTLLSDFTFLAMTKMQRCAFSIAGDLRTGNRKYEDGFPGMQCIYCADKPNPRKFFFSKPASLVNGMRRITGHVMACKHCPDSVKSKLHELEQTRYEQMDNLRGLQMVFVRLLFARLHKSVSVPQGSSLLVANANDAKVLGTTECLLRKNVEIFAVTLENKSIGELTNRKRTLQIGQVGLRCLHCSMAQSGKIDLDSCIFPSTVDKLRECVYQFQRHHFPKCVHIGGILKREMDKEKMTTSPVSESVREYWTNTAKTMGLRDLDIGVTLEQNVFQHRNYAIPVVTSKTREASTSTNKTKKTSSSFDIPVSRMPLELCADKPNPGTDGSTSRMYEIIQDSPVDDFSLPLNTVTPCASTCIKRKHDAISNQEFLDAENQNSVLTVEQCEV